MAEDAMYEDDEEALCSNHGFITTTMSARPCPECGKYEIVLDFNRCSRCAKKSNKCSLCDGPLK